MAKPGPEKGVAYTFTSEVKQTFLLELQRLGSIRAASSTLGISASTIRRHRASDPMFDAGCEQALSVLGKELISVARKLAIDGVERKTYDKFGNVTRVERIHNERVLLRWLERLMPNEWGNKKQIDHTVDGKVEHKHTGAIKVEDLTQDQQRMARKLLQSDRNLN